MNNTETSEIAALVQRVQSWPASMRLTLVRQILQTLERPSSPMLRGPSAAEIASRFRTDKPAPDDATVQQWIHDYRMEKYGK